MESAINSTPSRNWADLPSDILYCVLNKLTLLPDYIRFGVVCKSWLLIMLQQKQQRKESIQKEPPLLLIPVVDNLEERALYSVCEDKIYNHRFSIPYRRRCCGSSHGWWAIPEKDCAKNELTIILFNPFLGSTIRLPSILKDVKGQNHKAEPEFIIHKVILSCDPSLYPDDYVVAAIYGALSAKLAWFRSGEKSWIFGCKPFKPVKDILFHKGLLYGITPRHLAAVDYHFSEDEYEYEDDGKKPSRVKNDGTYMWTVASDNWDEYMSCCNNTYLVESTNGNLLLIRRIFYWDGSSPWKLEDTTGFKVYKLKLDEMNPENGEGKWVQIQGLENDDAIFLGQNHSICISASRFPNCKPNSIYYTDYYEYFSPSDPLHEATDMGIFHFENRSQENLFTLDNSLRYMTPAEWISPVLR